MVRSETFRKWAMALFSVSEEPHVQKTSFRVRKRIFATLDEEKRSASLKLSPVEQSVYLSAEPQAFRPATGAWGRQGWTLVDLSRATTGLTKDALEAAYREVTERR